MNRLIIIIILFIISFDGVAQDTSSLFSKIKYNNDKVTRYLDRENALSGYYSIDKNGIKMFASPNDKLNNNIENFISWDSVSILNRTTKKIINNEKKLSGHKIAIDPGHTAGDIVSGKLEQKHLKLTIKNEIGKSDTVEIAEGMLTFATAILLKEKLEKEGAEVFLTRKFNGSTAFGITFEDWLKTSFKKSVDSLYKIGEVTLEKKNWLLTKATKRDKFRIVFKDIELQKRAELINKYRPDITIIIHYNVDETNAGWAKPTTKNFDMTFVGGAFMKHDLLTKEKRNEFLQLLISDDLEESIGLSGEVVRSFEKILSVKTATINDAKYLRESCFATSEKGVFCRNLQLTRFIHSPLVYGETLYQDNIIECKLLAKEREKTKNERIQQVAEAYYQGIINFVLNQQQNKNK